MALEYPKIESGTVEAKLPLTIRYRQRVKVHQFADFTEQRYALGPSAQLKSFDLTYKNLTKHDKETLRNFFSSTKGELDTTFTFTLAGTTYENMAFDQHTFSAAMNRNKYWDVTLKMKQTRAA